MAAPRCAELPAGGGHYVLANTRVPTGCIEGAIPAGTSVCVDNLAQLDIEVREGKVAALFPAGIAAAHTHARRLDMRGKMVLPTFADLHTHIGAREAESCHECGRCLAGAVCSLCAACLCSLLVLMPCSTIKHTACSDIAVSSSGSRLPSSHLRVLASPASPMQTRATQQSAAETRTVASAAQTAARRGTPPFGTKQMCTAAWTSACAALTHTAPVRCVRTSST
jgi:hypothetical protein